MSRAVDAATGRTLVQDLEHATSWWGRFRGLMLRGALESGAGLRIEPCSSIHMMFMRFPIDAVFYGKDFRVTKVVRNVRPWTGIAFGGKGAHGVIELPAGAATAVEQGDLLEFANSKQGTP